MIVPREAPSPEHVGRHYDALDTFYREIWGDHLHHGLWLTGRESDDGAVHRLVGYALQHVDLPRGARVCDVGCGYGATAALIATEYEGTVTGLTISRRQHEYAERTYGGPRCHFLLRDWMQNELPDASFDAVIAIESLSHMPDKRRFFAEAFRVLRPAGQLVVLAWLAGDRDGRFARRHLLEPICSEGRLPSLPDRDDVGVLATAAGFNVGVTRLLTRSVRKTWGICLRRVLSRIATDRRYQRYLLSATSSDRRFLLTILRMIVAYRVGAMQYGLFVGRRPG